MVSFDDILVQIKGFSGNCFVLLVFINLKLSWSCEGVFGLVFCLSFVLINLGSIRVILVWMNEGFYWLIWLDILFIKWFSELFFKVTSGFSKRGKYHSRIHTPLLHSGHLYCDMGYFEQCTEIQDFILHENFSFTFLRWA